MKMTDLTNKFTQISEQKSGFSLGRIYFTGNDHY